MEINRIALIGNPNSGKTSVFNQLTGLNQRVGNYPGVTVDKKEGSFKIDDGKKIEVIDLPGVYSVFPKSEDEKVVYDMLKNMDNPSHPDLCVVVVDATNLERNLLLFTQVHDLGIPVILALNMADRLEGEGLEINDEKLSELLQGVPVVQLDAQKGEGIPSLKKAIDQFDQMEFHPVLPESVVNLKGINGLPSDRELVMDTNNRYKRINQILKFALKRKDTSSSRKNLSEKIDKIVTHPVLGYGIFLFILFLIFQAIYEFATIPMDLIDNVFLVLSQQIKETFPEGLLTNLLAEGIVPGLGGNCNFCTSDRPTLYVHCHIGGIRVHVSCGFYYGPPDASLRFEW